MTDIHTCSYYCTRPECVLAQRDELRDKNEWLRNRNAELHLELDRLKKEKQDEGWGEK